MLRLRIFLTCLFLLSLTVLANTAESEPAKDQQGDPLPTGAVARLGTVRWRHDDRVAFAAFLPDGKTIVSVGDDQTIRLWEFPSGKPIRRIDLSTADQPPVGPIQTTYLRAVALSKDGKSIATYFYFAYAEDREQKIRIHDLTTGKELPAPKGESRSFRSLTFSPNSKQLAYSTDDGVIHLWDLRKTQELEPYAPQGGRGGGGRNGPLLYTANGKSLLRLHTGSLVFLDLATGEEQQKSLDPRFGSVFAAVLSPDGKQLACSTSNRAIKIIEVASGKEIRTLQTNEGDFIRDSVFSKDGSKLYECLWSKLQVREWDTATGKVLRTFDVQPPTPSVSSGSVRISGGLGLSPDGKTLVLAGPQNALQLIDIATGKEIAAVGSTTNPLQELQFTPDSKTLLTWDSAAAVHRWDMATSKLLGPASRRDLSIAAVSPDGKFLAVQSPDAKNVFTLLDAGTGKAMGELTVKDRDNRVDLLFSPDSKTLAVHFRYERKVELYEVPNAKLRQTLTFKTNVPEPKSRAGYRPPKSLQAVTPNTMRFSADGKRLTCYSNENTISLWDVSTGQRLYSKSFAARDLIDGGVFTLDERCLAVGRSDGTVTWYELASGQPRRTYGKPPKNAAPKNSDEDLPLPSKTLTNVALSPDGKVLAHGGRDGLVHVWDLATGNEVAAFKGHTGPINAVMFAPDGKTLASASADTTALVWDMTKMQSPALPAKALSPDELKAAWQALAGADAAKAFTAIGDLAAAPKETVPFLKEQVKPATPLDGKRVADLLAQLDDDQPAVRQKATGDLSELGEQLLPVIEKTLATNPPLEVRKRLEEVRGKLTDPFLKGERLRIVRAVEVLERIGTPEARQVLQTLAAGAPEALVTKNAAAALKR